jgi:hypothetical protein
MAIGFNADGINSLTPLLPANSGLGGYLASNGNVCNDQVSPLGTRGYSASWPGSDYVINIQTGLVPRRIVWDWHIKAVSVVAMNHVERIINSYIIDGRPYELTDSDGRTTAQAILLGPDAGTGPITHRRAAVPSPYQIAHWRLVFQVCMVNTGVSEL